MKFKYVLIILNFIFTSFLFYLYKKTEYSNKRYIINRKINDRLNCNVQNTCLGNLICQDGVFVTPQECTDEKDCLENQACIYNICEK